MSSLPPTDPGASQDDAYFASNPDEDTGPVHVAPNHSERTAAVSGWPQHDDAPPTRAASYGYPAASNATPIAEDPYARRFSTPLTVDPRAPRGRGTGIRSTTVLVVVGVVVLLGALAFVLIRLFDKPESPNADASPSTTSAPALTAAQQNLMRVLPAGYAAGSCTPVQAPRGALAAVDCAGNADGGSPLSATYTLFADKAALQASFNGVTAAAHNVNCPGRIQSPGPWRRNANPKFVGGTLFCGLRQGIPTIAWTDDADLLVSVINGAREGPNLDQLYTWWSSHS